MKYVYAWGNNTKRAEMKGRRCEILHMLSRSSVHIRFDNGQEVITSRRALRRNGHKRDVWPFVGGGVK